MTALFVRMCRYGGASVRARSACLPFRNWRELVRGVYRLDCSDCRKFHPGALRCGNFYSGSQSRLLAGKLEVRVGGACLAG